MNNRDKKYLDKKRFEREGSDELIFELIQKIKTYFDKNSKKSEQVSVIEKFCFDVVKSKDLKEDDKNSLADTILKYAEGSGYLRIEKGRVSLTTKSKKYFAI